jgi:hypothetical protein
VEAGLVRHDGQGAGGRQGLGRLYYRDLAGCDGVDGTRYRGSGRLGIFYGKQEGYTKDDQANNYQSQTGAERVSLGAALATPHNEGFAPVDQHSTAHVYIFPAFNNRGGLPPWALHRFGTIQNIPDYRIKILFRHGELL